MRPAVKITSGANARVKAVARLVREKRQRERSGLLVAEGLRQVTRAAEAGLRLVELWVWPEGLGGKRADLEAAVAGARGAGEAGRLEVSGSVMAKMAYRGAEAEGVVAVFEQPQWELERLGEATEGLWLIAVGISKPGNLGAMARSAAGAGAAGVIVADGQVDAFNPNAIWASMGAVFALPVVGGEGEAARAWLKRRGMRLYAAALEGERRHDEVDYRGAVAIAVGAEDVGLDARWLTAARESGGGAVRIEMAKGVVDSLNASVAAGVMLFEAVRGRRE